MIHLHCGDAGRVRSLATELEARAVEHDLPLWGAGGLILDGWATATLGDRPTGLARLRRGAADWDALASIGDTFHNRLDTEICLSAGGFAAGPTAVRSELDAMGRTGYRSSESELHRLHGELLLHSHCAPARDALAELVTAYRMAAARDDRSFQLRAATSLARLFVSRGHGWCAEDLLSAVFGTFTEGLDTPDLVAANALLGTLTGLSNGRLAGGAGRKPVELP
ncbi:hypothetical protein [Leekyejoonella antrihumi]|uniref:Uncharacterized protein n=1 Tax=Leekyejoonella antrihumi TaxID=1660198 RepID=A0A563E399_9MICO|nr:hypothetical protein [Leekyejoonella antrihumi]TWP37000.1 hypothetical protein FGL98_08065 [Leekyejoonella antrihumi]